MNRDSLPPLPLQDWQDTLLTWQLMCQIVGKIRLRLHPKINHWWHVTLYVTPRGLSTGPMPYGELSFEIRFDILDQQLVVETSNGQSRRLPLQPGPIRDFYHGLFNALESLGIRVEIWPHPYRCKSTEPFPTDTVHDAYDGAAVRRAWEALCQINQVFTEFRGRFVGKCSPVHMFWHSFDLAVTRFNGRRGPDMADADRVTREAYSREVISAGFWFGDDDTIPAPTFYSYTFPAPDGLGTQRLIPELCAWKTIKGSPMALLMYEDVRRLDNPRQAVLDFLQSSYEAGAQLANWPREDLEVPVSVPT
ncbi:MAG TPA: DUF5996 family protein [Chloroflexota bacterium]|nr:DUF5996 family protein [Chloroflexota bacterium]